MVQMDAASQAAALALAEPLADSLTAYFARVREDPIANARRFTRATGDRSPRAIAILDGQGAVLVANALAHVRAIARALSPDALVFGAAASARAVLETAATAHWLLGHAIDPSERVARSFAPPLRWPTDASASPDRRFQPDRWPPR